MAATMQRGLDILCVANDWSADPTSKHQLMKRLANSHRVLWVEGSGMRKPDLRRSRDWRRIVRKARAFMAPARNTLPGLSVYCPPAVPLPGSQIARAINTRLYRLTLRREMRRLGFAPAPIIWVYLPHVAPLIRSMPRRLLVYHCVDRWSAFEDYDATLMERLEADLCRSADVIFASAEDLAERCQQHNSNVHYTPHGVDFAHFARALDAQGVPDDLRDIPEPRVGFFGLIHEWVDIDLIRQLAERLPYSFVLIGDAKTKLEPLQRLPNVFHLGRRPYATLPDYCSGFQTAIVPFRRSVLTRSVNPIKLREYAAAGLPVVSTDLPEVRRCADIATCATDLESWLGALRAAVRQGHDQEERRKQSERVRGQDWSVVCNRMTELVMEAAATGSDRLPDGNGRASTRGGLV
jgi:glycosyltransferase involved in cell wall biosynthesis